MPRGIVPLDGRRKYSWSEQGRRRLSVLLNETILKNRRYNREHGLQRDDPMWRPISGRALAAGCTQHVSVRNLISGYTQTPQSDLLKELAPKVYRPTSFTLQEDGSFVVRLSDEFMESWEELAAIADRSADVPEIRPAIRGIVSLNPGSALSSEELRIVRAALPILEKILMSSTPQPPSDQLSSIILRWMTDNRLSFEALEALIEDQITASKARSVRVQNVLDVCLGRKMPTSSELKLIYTLPNLLEGSCFRSVAGEPYTYSDLEAIANQTQALFDARVLDDNEVSCG